MVRRLRRAILFFRSGPVSAMLVPVAKQTMKYNEYLYEWVNPMMPEERVRVLLVGDFFLYEAREALDAMLPCVVDAVGGNTPLACRTEHLRGVLAQRPYTAVVVQEARRPGTAADMLCLPDLVNDFPQIRFMVATGLPPHLVKVRYATPAEAMAVRNDVARATAEALGLPCLDMAQQVQAAGLGTRTSACVTAVRNSLLSLFSGKKQLSLRAPGLRVMQEGLCRQVAELLDLGEPRPSSVFCDRDSSILWQNRYHVPHASCICIGDSNMFRFRLGSPFLSRRADSYTSTLNPLSEQALREYRAALRPEHRVVVLSLGVHHLMRRCTPDFDDRCRALLSLMQENGRKVVALATTPCGREENIAEQDEEKNAVIRGMNERFRALATAAGCDFADAYAVMEQEPHTDPVHFNRKSNRRVAELLTARCRAALRS